MSEIKFYQPSINNTNPHTLVITFPFDVIQHSSNTEYDKKYHKEISVSITDVLLAIWNYKDISEQEKVLFQFVLDKIKCISLEELLKENFNIFLDRGNQEPNKPFDPNKIPNPDGFTIEIDDNISKPKNKIGF